MAYAKRVIKLISIMNFIEEKKILEKGENAVESGHVRRMDYDPSLKIIRGDVHASMRDKSYKVDVFFNDTGEITSATCICPRGIKCHHIAALLMFGHQNISITDTDCSWIVTKCPGTEVVTAEELYPPKNKEYTAINRKPTTDDLSEFKNQLMQCGATVGFSWLLQEEQQPNEITNVVPLIEDLLSSQECIDAKNKTEFLRQHCAVTQDMIEQVAKLTTGQRHNSYWFLYRKYRLTASNFGQVLSKINTSRFPKSLFKSLVGMYNLEGVKSIQWGTIHEKCALEQFEKEFDVRTEPTGIWLSPSGVLGASPDALLGDDSTVEIKCPYSLREMDLTAALVNKKDYVVYIEDGVTIINTNHPYYHQIQGTLHILNRAQCYLVIWTTKGSMCVYIEKDPAWSMNLQKLESFFFEMYIPKIINGTYR